MIGIAVAAVGFTALAVMVVSGSLAARAPRSLVRVRSR